MRVNITVTDTINARVAWGGTNEHESYVDVQVRTSPTRMCGIVFSLEDASCRTVELDMDMEQFETLVNLLNKATKIIG